MLFAFFPPILFSSLFQIAVLMMSIFKFTVSFLFHCILLLSPSSEDFCSLIVYLSLNISVWFFFIFSISGIGKFSVNYKRVNILAFVDHIQSVLHKFFQQSFKNVKTIFSSQSIGLQDVVC